MAITASGLFVATFVDVLDSTQLALDLDLETHKLALFADTITPNFDTDTAYGVAPYNAGEIVGTNWPAGGILLTGTTFTGAAGTATFDAADVSVALTTVADSGGGLIYADALPGNNVICMIFWGSGDFSTNNGTFGVAWNAAGIFYIDLTP